MTFQEVMTWLNNGLAVVIVIVSGFGVYKIVRWIGQELVLPLRDASVQHLNKTNECLETMAESTTSLNETMSSIREQLSSVCKHKTV